MKSIISTVFCGLIIVSLFSCEKEKEVPVSSVSIGQATAEMLIGETVQLSATVLPSDASDKTVSWASSKQSVATVSNTGLVTAIAEGTSTITASAGEKSSTCIVTVSKKDIEVSSIELNNTSASLKVGETVTLTATVKPDDATDKTVTWTSSDSSVATVDNGKVSAIKEGTATITAKAGQKQASCVITVAKRVIEVESIELNKPTLELVEGDSETLVATVKPDDATDKTVTWTSSDSSVATVDNGKVSAIKEGTATITAKAGQKQASCVVNVSPKIVHVEGVVLNETNIEIDAGSSFELIATVYPDSATNKDIIWTSSNDSVATVDAGIVNGVYPGEATIKATTVDGAFSAICNVTVVVPEFNGLTFTASGNASIGLQKTGSPNEITLEYSRDGFTWINYTVGEFIAFSDGEKLMFRAGKQKNEKFCGGPFDYYTFTSNGLGTFAASGNIMSLLDRDYNTPLSQSCFNKLFANCTDLSSAPELPATSLCFECYEAMFSGCTGLSSAPKLPAIVLAEDCYNAMFSGCTGLTLAPELPATNMERSCYARMFRDCIGLTKAPLLPATTLNEYCYEYMFSGCTGLTAAPELPATTLTEFCYLGMFWGCSGLSSAPKLPATTLARGCYDTMFGSCTGLAAAPELPATTLASDCYNRMFYECTSLTTAPLLPAIVLSQGCYSEMFRGCKNLNYIKALFKTTPGNEYTKDWLTGVSKTGTFVKANYATWDVTGSSGIPSGWTVQIE